MRTFYKNTAPRASAAARPAVQCREGGACDRLAAASRAAGEGRDHVGGGRGTLSGNSAPRPHSRGRERSKGAAPLAPPKQAGGKPKCLECSGGSRWRGRAGAGAAGPQTLGRPARGQAGKEIGAGFRLCDLSSPRTLQKRGGGRRADMGAPGGGDRRAGSDTAGGAPRRGRAGGGHTSVAPRAHARANV